MHISFHGHATIAALWVAFHAPTVVIAQVNSTAVKVPNDLPSCEQFSDQCIPCANATKPVKCHCESLQRNLTFTCEEYDDGYYYNIFEKRSGIMRCPRVSEFDFNTIVKYHKIEELHCDPDKKLIMGPIWERSYTNRLLELARDETRNVSCSNFEEACYKCGSETYRHFGPLSASDIFCWCESTKQMLQIGGCSLQHVDYSIHYYRNNLLLENYDARTGSLRCPRTPLNSELRNENCLKNPCSCYRRGHPEKFPKSGLFKSTKGQRFFDTAMVLLLTLITTFFTSINFTIFVKFFKPSK